MGLITWTKLSIKIVQVEVQLSGGSQRIYHCVHWWIAADICEAFVF